ncbi:MAG TPA: HPF/RaiA family ribosome-associated protein [Candidatus Paceibacterota bacterium]|nr:HPF/RaiA family ribosome-associated protein [Candidatus Paceibacterota bacterium]
MQIHFKGTNYELPAHISELARRKIESLGKYIGKDKEVARAYADFGKESEAHKNGSFWRVDINFDVHGNRFYAKAVEESIEKALDKAVSELAISIKTARKREQSLMKKGGGVIKSLMRGLQS